MWWRGGGGRGATRTRARPLHLVARSLQVSLVRSPGVRGSPNSSFSRPAPPLCHRSAFAKAADSGCRDTATKATAAGEAAADTACLATARAAVPVPAEAAPGSHDSADGCRARRARARSARGARGGRAPRRRWGRAGARARGPGSRGSAGALRYALPGRTGAHLSFPRPIRLFPPAPHLERCFG